MGKKNPQNKQKQQRERSRWIPPVGNGGIQKKHQSNHPPPSFVAPSHPHNQANYCQIPGYPILPFAVQLQQQTQLVASIPMPPTPYQPPPSQPPPTNLSFIYNPRTILISPSSIVPHYTPPIPVPSIPIPPTVAPINGTTPTPIPTLTPAPAPIPKPITIKTPRRQKNTAGIILTVQSKGEGGGGAKKTQLKYARQLAARANKRSSIAAMLPEVKREPGVPSFNLFMNIAQRYRAIHKEPEAIEIQDDVAGTDEVEAIEVEEEQESGEANEQNDAPVNNTLGEDMSICTVDEVGDQTMAAIVEEEEGAVREVEGEIAISDDDGDEEEEEIVCLGEQKTKHVMSELVTLGDDNDSECEIEEVDVANETINMNKAFSEKRKSLLPTPRMEQSIIDLSLDDDERANTVAELPDFIPLIDAGNKQQQKNGKGQFAQPLLPAAGRRVQGVQQQNGTASSNWSPMVMLTRTKSKRERKRESYRKRAETRALELGASPATVARAVASATCTSSFPQSSFTPSKIPLPSAAAPPTPLAHLWRFPPGSAPSASSSTSSAMGLIQSRGISTSAPQSQPVGMGGFGMSHPGGPTLAGVLHDEAEVVKDALTANGIYRRQWEEKWMAQGTDALSSTSSASSPPLDPSAAPFRICSYNVLCQKTISATQYLYRHTRFQPHVLTWSHRWPLIQKELSGLNADVFGLQEIQDVHFEEYYEPFMKSLGYMCFFQRKSETNHSDGLGVFVRANRFKISSVQIVDFLVPGDNLLNRGNVAQLLRLECQQTGASLIVTNTHILFNEKRGDVKLAQIALLMANIHALRQEGEPVICLGDWNLEPTSDLYNYITIGSLDANQFVPRYGSGQLREGRQFNMNPMRDLPMDTHLKTRMGRDGVLYPNEGELLQSLRGPQQSIFSHQIPLTSTYAPYRDRRVSTFHKDMANPDFIFYTTEGRGETESRRLRLIRRLAVPPEANMRANLEPWPNHQVPSDHIPLMAEFYLAK